MNRLAIIVPCYNEEEVLTDTEQKLTKLVKDLIKKKKISDDSFILFVNDGSKDRTWSIITELHKSNKFVYGLCLAGNVGHQNALLAGLNQAISLCDMSISIDADLQDDISVIEEMIDKYNSGIDIVGVLTQYESVLLNSYVAAGGRWGFCVIIGGSDGGAASACWCAAGACYYVGLGFAFLDPDRDVRDGRVQ